VEGKDEIQYQANSLNQYERILTPPQKEEALIYDEDGNLIEDGRFRYSWNAENRLVAVDPKFAKAGAKRLEFAYDYMGRRTKKEVFAFVNNDYIPSGTTLFIYDGWNMVKEIKKENQATVSRSYLWGLDLSQSLQGAGGVGGLLAVSDGSFRYSYMFDANGNVGQIIDVEEESVAARHEYDPSGRLSSYHGLFALRNSYRFSTKYYDNEADVYYYGYRHYSPDLGRWLNKDNLGEKGGINLFAFIGNNPISEVDYLGHEGVFENIVGFADGILTSARIVVGVAGSVIDLDAFRERGTSPVKGNEKNNCQFLITINGMLNDYESAEKFAIDLMEIFPNDFGDLDNFGFVNNPTTYVTDFIQVGILELRGIGVPSITTAQYIEESYNHAVEHGCNCIDIFIVAHSQGAAILNNALPLVANKIKPYLRIVTIGGEQFVYEKSLGFIINYDSKGDIIPELSPWNIRIPEETIPEEEVPGHGRKHYIDYWRRNGLPKGLFR
jgi:RHS repeat-associated protein